jgi:hypothetical protein
MTRDEIQGFTKYVTVNYPAYSCTDETLLVLHERFSHYTVEQGKAAVDFLVSEGSVQVMPNMQDFVRAFRATTSKRTERLPAVDHGKVKKLLAQSSADIDRQMTRLRGAYKVRQTSKANFEWLGAIPDSYATDPTLEISDLERKKLSAAVKTANEGLKKFWANPDAVGSYEREGKYHLIPQHPKNPLWQKQVAEAKRLGLKHVPSGLLGADIASALGKPPASSSYSTQNEKPIPTPQEEKQYA